MIEPNKSCCFIEQSAQFVFYRTLNVSAQLMMFVMIALFRLSRSACAVVSAREMEIPALSREMRALFSHAANDDDGVAEQK